MGINVKKLKPRKSKLTRLRMLLLHMADETKGTIVHKEFNCNILISECIWLTSIVDSKYYKMLLKG